MDQRNIVYRISEKVFSQFPGYVRGVVAAYGVENGDSPEALVDLLRSAEDDLRSRLDPDKIADHPRMASWREAYRAFGAKPAKFRPSMEAMARRALKNQALPTINALVDIGNVISLRRLVPAGGHAVDVLTQDIELRHATGDEEFVPFGSDQTEHPEQGEIIFVEGDIVLTRRWTWRQSNHTLVLPTTTAIELNIDGMPPVEASEIEDACKEAAELIREYCGGKSRYEILGGEHPEMSL